jgi:hypothetical protein
MLNLHSTHVGDSISKLEKQRAGSFKSVEFISLLWLIIALQPIAKWETPIREFEPRSRALVETVVVQLELSSCNKQHRKVLTHFVDGESRLT